LDPGGRQQVIIDHGLEKNRMFVLRIGDGLETCGIPNYTLKSQRAEIGEHG